MMGVHLNKRCIEQPTTERKLLSRFQGIEKERKDIKFRFSKELLSLDCRIVRKVIPKNNSAHLSRELYSPNLFAK